MLRFVCFLSMVTVGFCYPTGHISDNANARKLFAKVNTGKDNHLSRKDFDGIFQRFDLNGDNKIGVQEFVSHWGVEKLGSPPEAVYLFYNLDVNKDGVISHDPDLQFIYSWFDSDNSGQVTEAEFIVTWQKLTAYE